MTASAVISPLNSDSWVMSASAFADAFVATAVVAVAVVEAALTTEPSAGKANAEVVTGCAAGGDADVAVAVTGWFGTAIRIAYALAAAPGELRVLAGARRDERERREQERQCEAAAHHAVMMPVARGTC